MARKVIDLGGGLIKKFPSLEYPAPAPINTGFDDPDAFSCYSDYLAYAQTLKEVEVWDDCSWATRQVLCPILQFSYVQNTPTIIMPYMRPLMSEKEALQVDSDSAFSTLVETAYKLGCDDYQIERFYQGVLKNCESFNLSVDDILNNLSNIGFTRMLGLRVIDYGLTTDMIELKEDFPA